MSRYELSDKAGEVVPFKLLDQDGDVRCLSTKQNDLLTFIYNHYADSMIEQIALWQTVHGHIVMLTKQGGRFIPNQKGQPGRFVLEDMRILSHPSIRWVEFGTDTLKLGI